MSQTESFLLREASADDIDAMHAVRTAVHENRLSRPDRIQRSEYEALLTSGRGWVCEVDRRIVAFGMADADRRSIWALFVMPAFESRGIGQALLTTMTRWLFERGDEAIWLTTGTGTRAERFYRLAGWHDAGIDPTGERRFELTRV